MGMRKVRYKRRTSSFLLWLYSSERESVLIRIEVSAEPVPPPTELNTVKPSRTEVRFTLKCLKGFMY